MDPERDSYMRGRERASLTSKNFTTSLLVQLSTTPPPPPSPQSLYTLILATLPLTFANQTFVPTASNPLDLMSSGDNSGFAPPGGFLSSNRISGFGYGLGISVGVLLLITTITLMSYFCARANTSPSLPPRPGGSTANTPDVEAGLDEATLMSYPTVLYSEAKLREKGAAAAATTTTTASCCSICLADYKDTDVLRLLPDCGHLFHLKCVDLWLRSRPTCPVCRSSPLPSPLPTPLAEVIPLARQF